jgi:hypothetical protein
MYCLNQQKILYERLPGPGGFFFITTGIFTGSLVVFNQFFFTCIFFQLRKFKKRLHF